MLVQAQAAGNYITTSQNECTTKPGPREGRKKGIEPIDHLSKLTTRKGSWQPSLYRFLMYGRVNTLDNRRRVHEKPSNW